MASLERVRYYRYMDDIRIVGERRADVVAALHQLDEQCRRRGLALSTKKTAVHAGAAAIASLVDHELDAVAYAFDQGDNDATLRPQLAALFKAAVKPGGLVERRRASFSLKRLLALREARVRQRVLENLEHLGALGWLVPAYLLPWLSNSVVQSRIADFLDDPERNTSDYISAWLFAAMLELPSRSPRSWVHAARKVAFDRMRPTYHRALALNVLALGQDALDIRDVEDVLKREYDPEILRAGLVALARVSRLRRATVEQVLKRVPTLESTVTYLRGRRTLPSLIQAGAVVEVRRDADPQQRTRVRR